MSNTVKWLAWNMPGAPTMNQTHGELIAVLDACLVDGFNPKTPTGITRSGSIATIGLPVGHGYEAGRILRVGGAAQTEYNGDKLLLSVTATSATYAVTGTPTTPATGTFTAKFAPLGWEKVFSSTNRAAYRSPNVLSTRPYLYVDNSASATWSPGRGINGTVESCESMADIDTRVNPVPRDTTTTRLDGWLHWYQARGAGTKTSTGHGSYNRSWVIVGDDRSFYFLNNPCTGQGRAVWGYGDFISFKPSDGFPVFLMGAENYDDNVNYNVPAGLSAGNSYNQSVLNGCIVQRSYFGIGAQANFSVGGLYFTPGSGGNTIASGYNSNWAFPNQADASMLLSPKYVYESNQGVRGQLPGAYAILQTRPYGDLTVVDNVAGYPDRKFLVVAADAYDVGNPTSGAPAVNLARHAFDITGPWH